MKLSLKWFNSMVGANVLISKYLSMVTKIIFSILHIFIYVLHKVSFFIVVILVPDTNFQKFLINRTLTADILFRQTD